MKKKILISLATLVVFTCDAQVVPAWVDTLPAPDQSVQGFVDFSVDSAGNSWVLTHLQTSTPFHYLQYAAVLTKYNNNGDQLWKNTFENDWQTGNYLLPYDLETDKEDNAYVLYTAGYGIKHAHSLLKKFSPSGMLLWSIQLDDFGYKDTEGKKIYISKQNIIYIIADLDNNPFAELPGRVLLEAIHPNGDKIWSQKYNPGELSLDLAAPFSTCLGVDDQSNIYFGGANGAFTKGFIFIVDNNGNQLSSNEYDWTPEFIDMDPQNNCIVASETNIGESVIIQKLNLLHEIFSLTYNVNDNSHRLKALKTDSQGRINVSIASSQAITLHISQSGTLLWERKYGDAGLNETEGMDVDADGRIYEVVNKFPFHYLVYSKDGDLYDISNVYFSNALYARSLKLSKAGLFISGDINSDIQVILTMKFDLAYYKLAEQSSATGLFTTNPNPVQNQLTINLPASLQTATLAIYDADGRQLNLPMTITSTQVQLNTTQLPAGFYMLQITDTQTGKAETAKFIK